MKKSLAALTVSAAFVLTAALPAHAGPAVTITDPVGDTKAAFGTTDLTPEAIAAADLHGFTITPAKKSLTATWTVAKVDAPSSEWAQTFNVALGWKAKKQSKGVMLSTSNFTNTVKFMGEVPKEACKGATVTRTDTTVTAKVPYRCVPAWKKGQKIAAFQVMTYATAADDGLYSDSSAMTKANLVLK